MKDYLEELLEKYQDIHESADDWVEKNLSQEILEDLHELGRLNRV